MNKIIPLRFRDMWVVVGVVVVVVAVATYVTWLAARVDRLHARAAAASTALADQSARRAEAAAELGERLAIPGLAEAAQAVRKSDTEDRAGAENDLTRILRVASAEHEPQELVEVAESSRHLALARQVHTDLVRDALAVRRRPIVRLLRLTRRHPEPAFYDIDDPTLEARAS